MKYSVHHVDLIKFKHTYVTGGGGSAFGSSQAHSSFPIWSCHIFHRSHGATQKRFIRQHQTRCLPNCQQMDHVCRTLNSILTKPSKNLPPIQSFYPDTSLPWNAIQMNESLPDLIHLNTFIYKWVQVWVISLIFHTWKIVYILLMVLHLLHIAKDWKFMIT